MRTALAFSFAALSLVALGCGSSEDSTPSATRTDAGTVPSSDSGAPATADAATPPVSTDAGTPSGATATLTGKVKRVATTNPSAGGKGPIYVAVFDADPVTNRQNARSVGNALIADADMTSATAAVPYTITNLPPRSQQYFVIAFLDDNKTATTANPAPDRGDLVSMDGFSAPKVTLATATSVTLDLNLTMALPF
jgi:hypothetical protein